MSTILRDDEIIFIRFQGPGLYMVSDDGERISDNLFSVGSGSIYAYSILDAGYK